MRRDREDESGLHTARISLYRRIDERFDSRKIDNLVKLADNLGSAHAENGAIEEDIFTTTELGMEFGPDFEQGSGTAVQHHLASRGGSNLRDDFQERALA